MITNPIEIEGTWEQIAALAPRFVGHKMRLTLLPESVAETPGQEDSRSLEEKMAEILSRVPDEEWTKYSGPICQDTERTFFKLGSAPFPGVVSAEPK